MGMKKRIMCLALTAARYISSTPLCYVNCCDKQYSVKYYILQATNWLTHGYGESPWRPRAVYITASGIFPVAMGKPIHIEPLVYP